MNGLRSEAALAPYVGTQALICNQCLYPDHEIARNHIQSTTAVATISAFKVFAHRSAPYRKQSIIVSTWIERAAPEVETTVSLNLALLSRLTS
jgi:hypothetical protein